MLWTSVAVQVRYWCNPSLSHLGRLTHIWVSKLTTIGSDNCLSPCWRQAIILTNAGLYLTGPLGARFGEIIIEIYSFSFKKMHLKMSSAKRRPFFLALNVLTDVTRMRVSRNWPTPLQATQLTLSTNRVHIPWDVLYSKHYQMDNLHSKARKVE